MILNELTIGLNMIGIAAVMHKVTFPYEQTGNILIKNVNLNIECSLNSLVMHFAS